LRGAGTPMLVTDAMPPVGGTRHGFNLAGKPIRVEDGRCTTADGTLAGSASTWRARCAIASSSST